MEYIGEANDRKIFYIKPGDENWFNILPDKDWLAVPIGDDKAIEQYIILAEICLDKKVTYVCTLGKCCELIHDIFDEEVVNRKVIKGEDFDSPMTTWHHNFDEGFWFATTAHDEDKLIDTTIICIDYTKGVKNYLVELVKKIQSKWLPLDDNIKLPEYDV